MRKCVGLAVIVVIQLLAPAGARAAVANGQLWAVSCSAPAACTGVGDSVVSSTGMELPLAERFNGASWQAQTVPVPSGTQWADLHGVSCPSASYCVAVGTLHRSGISRVFAEAWNGSSWQMLAPVAPLGSKVSGLAGVACRSASDCTAVGFAGRSAKPGQTLAETWNGSQWQLQTTPNVNANSHRLLSVSCPSASTCTAVGYFVDGAGVQQPLAERSTGSTWALAPVPAPQGGVLNGVSCPAATSCTAVGSSAGAALAEHFDGAAWHVQPAPNVAGSLAAVSCPADGACVAVGNSGAKTLAERLSGSTWSVQSTPNPAGSFASFLQGVSCPAVLTCQAGGYWEPTSTTIATLAEGFNGSAWSLEPSP